MSGPPQVAATAPSTTDSSESDDENGWEEQASDTSDKFDVKCLFCADRLDTIERFLEHCKTDHSFDFVGVFNSLDVDQTYGYIKYINFLRCKGQKSQIPTSVTAQDLENDTLLQPILPNDPLLYSFGDIFPNANLDAETEEDEVNEWTSHEFALRKLSFLEDLVKKLRIKSIEEMALEEQVASKADGDRAYFESYGTNGIHYTMLSDKVRTDSYFNFINRNKDIFKGKVVLDVGCGTGILSMFCAQAGAAKVIGVEMSRMAIKAREIVKRNGLEHIIDIYQGRVEDDVSILKAPNVGVDIIVSEWMGYGLLFESMLDSVLYARDRYLKPGGLMVPSHTTLRIAPISDESYIAARLNSGFWSNVYGFDMSPMMANEELNVRDTYVDDVPITSLAADSVQFLELNTRQCKVENLDFRAPFSFRLDRDVACLEAFCIWFDCFFLPLPRANDEIGEEKAQDWPTGAYSEGVAFTTGPGGLPTHWRSVVLLIEEEKRPTGLPVGTTVKGFVDYRKLEERAQRGLRVSISWAVGDKEERKTQSWVCTQ